MATGESNITPSETLPNQPSPIKATTAMDTETPMVISHLEQTPSPTEAGPTKEMVEKDKGAIQEFREEIQIFLDDAERSQDVTWNEESIANPVEQERVPAVEARSVEGITGEDSDEDHLPLSIKFELKKKAKKPLRFDTKESTIPRKKRTSGLTPKKRKSTTLVSPKAKVTKASPSPRQEKKKCKKKSLQEETGTPSRIEKTPAPATSLGLSEVLADIDKETPFVPYVTEARRESFANRAIVPGKVIGNKVTHELLEIVSAHGWSELMLLQERPRKLAKLELAEFYANAYGTNRQIWSCVKEKVFDLTPSKLGSLLKIPSTGWNEYVQGTWPDMKEIGEPIELVRKFAQDNSILKPRPVLLKELNPLHKMLLAMVFRMILPRDHRRTEAMFLDMVIMELLLQKKQIDLPALMIKHIHRVACSEDQKSKHALGYGFWLGDVFDHLGVGISNWTYQGAKDILGENDGSQVATSSKKESSLVKSLRMELAEKEKIVKSQAKEITELKEGIDATMEVQKGSFELVIEKKNKILAEMQKKMLERNSEILRERGINDSLMARIKHLEAMVTRFTGQASSSSQRLPPLPIPPAASTPQTSQPDQPDPPTSSN